MSAFEQEMETTAGRLVSLVVRKQNLMRAGVRYGPEDFSVEEARVLELIELERPAILPSASESHG